MSAQYPDDLFYTKDHEWARIEDRDGTKVATIGVTRFAVEQLGDACTDAQPEVVAALGADMLVLVELLVVEHLVAVGTLGPQVWRVLVLGAAPQ